MNEWLGGTADERMRNVFTFYMVIFGLLVGFLVGEVLITDYVLGQSLTFFEHMIPSSILYGLMFLFTMWYAKRTSLTNEEMGWHTSYVPKSLVIGLLATSGFLIAAIGFQLPLFYTSFFDIFIILCFTLVIGVTEEISFRGFIQGKMLKDQAQWKAVLMTGMLFALLHVPSYIISGNYLNAIGLPSLILAGLILGYIRIHTGNIWGVIIAHATWDFYLFLYSPVISLGSPVMELLTLLGASGAMWGSLLLAMFIAKLWIDRPTQMPSEMAAHYQLIIERLPNRIWKLNDTITTLKIRGNRPPHWITHYTDRVRIYEQQIEIYKEYLPQINEQTYKILRELVPYKLKLIKVEYYLAKGDLPMRMVRLEAKKAMLWEKIQFLESQLGASKYISE